MIMGNIKTILKKIGLGLLVFIFSSCFFISMTNAKVDNDVVEVTDYKETSLAGINGISSPN